MLGRIVTAGIGLLVWLTNLSLADHRTYVWTYEYLTMPKGELELENYLDYKAPDWGDKSTSQWTHQLELEYGIIDHWDVALYQVFSQNNADGYKYDQMKFRMRYRFFETGLFMVDPLLYLEYKRPANASDPNVLEGKVILARNISQFNVAGNFIIERELVAGAEWETEYALGANYGISEIFKGGIETAGNFKSGDENEISLGPTIAFKSNKFSLSTGVLWGLNANSDDFRFRYILGLEL